jgi:hypothetical protein
MALTNTAPKLDADQMDILVRNACADIDEHAPYYRTGQALMNRLHEISPALYEEVTHTDADCFYSDKQIPAFTAYIAPGV